MRKFVTISKKLCLALVIAHAGFFATTAMAGTGTAIPVMTVEPAADEAIGERHAFSWWEGAEDSVCAATSEAIATPYTLAPQLDDLVSQAVDEESATEEVECAEKKAFDITGSAYIELRSAKAKGLYQTDANFKSIIDGFNRAGYTASVGGVPAGTSLARVDAALRATLKELLGVRLQIASLNLAGVKEGTDYKIQFAEIQIIEYLKKCCAIFKK